MNDDERWQGIAIYGLYLVALFTGVPFLLGVLLAYLFKGNADPAIRTHFEHQISIFWRIFLGGILAWTLIVVGAPLTVILIGIPMILTGVAILLYSFIYVLVRCLRGIGRLNQYEAYDDPYSWAP
ncbi:MAG: hypothetical protein AAF830_02640 [Pseudomonadota bacterium]